jgi:hypothetical protein
MSELVIFVCTGLLVYWSFRTLLLLKGSQEEIDETLEGDLWWGRRLLLGLRAMFGGPTQLAG